MADAPSPVHVVCGLLVRDGRALLVHRSPHRRWYPDVWDLPGGHVEPGEAPAGALVRELREELGVVAQVSGPPTHHLSASDHENDVWVVRAWRGQPHNGAPDEHDALAWLTAAEASALPLADPRLVGLLTAALLPSG